MFFINTPRVLTPTGVPCAQCWGADHIPASALRGAGEPGLQRGHLYVEMVPGAEMRGPDKVGTGNEGAGVRDTQRKWHMRKPM